MKYVLDYLDNLLKQNDTLVVATSGGPDSMALLDILTSYKEKLNLKIVVAHINHNVRKESYKDEELVKAYALNKDLIFEGMEINESINRNFEMEARKIRYNFFKELIKKYDAKYLFTAHHGDDLIETILMRLSRGSVLKGYKGINVESKKEGYVIVRPLLWLDKNSILNYVKEHNIDYIHDYTNDQDDHTRNKYRHNVLPFLKNENENIHLKYKQFSDELSMYDEFIENYLDNSGILNNGKIDIGKFNNENILIKTKLLERLLNEAYDGFLEVINKTHVNNIIDLIKNNKANSYINLPNNYLGLINYKYFEIVKNETFEDIDVILDKDLIINNKKFTYNYNSDEKSNYVIRLDSNEIKLPLHLRNRKDGDKIEVKNLNGAKKVSDILTNEKLDLFSRKNILLLCDSDNNILWIPGIKKSKFDKEKTEKYDIIVKYILNEEEYNDYKQEK